MMMSMFSSFDALFAESFFGGKMGVGFSSSPAPSKKETGVSFFKRGDVEEVSMKKKKEENTQSKIPPQQQQKKQRNPRFAVELDGAETWIPNPVKDDKKIRASSMWNCFDSMLCKLPFACLKIALSISFFSLAAPNVEIGNAYVTVPAIAAAIGVYMFDRSHSKPKGNSGGFTASLERIMSKAKEGAKATSMPKMAPQLDGLHSFETLLKGLLKRYDTNGDGKLSRKELQVALQCLGFKHCGWKARKAMRHADTNGDGFINDDEMDELLKYCKQWGYKFH
ncbi:EF-hand domain [Dillenia turbinata]|uniref:EF-hand domain n=1 Tax=Dillenia turbinata TaxID=194707 RepID=A0AAN8ZA63_9MAGN